jgi:hypothetical protein
MADPFTILGAAATIVSLVDLGIKICKTLNEMSATFSSVPQTISQLHDEISTLGSVLSQLQLSLEGGKHHILENALSSEAKHGLHLGLNSCKKAYLRLRKILDKFSQYSDLKGLSSSITPIVSIRVRFRWMLEESEVLKIRQDLQAQKLSLNIALTWAGK